MKIRTFILAGSILTGSVLFAGSYLAVSRAFDVAVTTQARESAEATARTTFVAMYELMSTGWSRAQAERFVARTREANAGQGGMVQIYRGPRVEALYGPIEQPALDADLEQVLLSGHSFHRVKDENIRLLYPLQAEEKCLGCHHNATVGDTLGVIEVRQDLTPALTGLRGGFLAQTAWWLLPAAFLTLLGVFLVNRRVGRALDGVEARVAEVNAVADLRKLEFPREESGFEEIHRILGAVEELVKRLRAVAVDKDMLTFEIGLLEKFVITSEIIRDWHEYVNHLVRDINKVMPAHLLFSLFQIDDELFDLEIFWFNPPNAGARAQVERHIRDILERHPRFSAYTHFNINHHVAEADASEVELDEETLALHVKSFFVDTPKIGGIVGVGVHANELEDETRHLVLDSVLSTLLNVVGSVKAIYKYTRDLEYYATRDPLTDLFNQRVFWELLGYEIDRAKRHDCSFGVLLIDLDNFKLVNDHYDHATGDRFLQLFARTVHGVLRGGDIFARYGGDEFVVILPEAELPQVSEVAHRILHAVRDMTLDGPDGTPIRATASIGMAVFPEHATEAKDLFLFADNMMYRAKAEGKERVAIPSSDDVVEVFRDISNKSVLILNAIEERKLVPHFQPILDVRSNTVAAYEVLCRMPLEGRILRADEFVEIAEKMGVIHRLDCLIIEEALGRLRDAGHDGLMFLNLSPRALVLNEFAKSVRRVVADSGVDPSRIVFEITERDTVKNLSLVQRFLNDLKFDGFKLAIDDFGSGFSSFHYLRHFPVDYLKVEGDFVMNILQSPRDRAFVQSMQSLAQELGIQVVAEFVESAEVLEELRRMGVDLAQGYYIGRPEPQILHGAWSPAGEPMLV